MKNLILVLAVVLFASCEKERTCTCTTTGGGYSATTSVTMDMTRKDCKDASNTINAGGITVVTTCSID